MAHLHLAPPVRAAALALVALFSLAPRSALAEPKRVSEQTERPAASPAADDSAPWYEHKSWMPKDPKRPKAPRLSKPYLFPVSAIFDVHGFLPSFVGGPISGTGSVLRLAAGIPARGYTVELSGGLYFPNGAGYLGMTFGRNLRYSFIPSLYKSGDVDLHVAAGHFEFGAIVGGVPATINALSASPFGLRFSHGSAQIVADLRPTAGLWVTPDPGVVTMSFGVSLSAGYVFSFGGGAAPQKKIEEAPREEDDARLSNTGREVL